MLALNSYRKWVNIQEYSDEALIAEIQRFLKYRLCSRPGWESHFQESKRRKIQNRINWKTWKEENSGRKTR